MKTFAGLAAAVVLALGAAACSGGGSSSYVARVGPTRITKAQLQSVLALARKQYRARGIPLPAPGIAEYRLLRDQALDFLTQQALAHLVDKKLGIKPGDRVATDASFRKVTGTIHAGDPEVLRKQRAAAMHRAVSDAERRWPTRYAPGYEPVSEMTLARQVWMPAAKRKCDLPAGNYTYAKALAHGCVSSTDPLPGQRSPVCSLIDLPLGPNGFTTAEENDGYADYLESNAGTCVPDPRQQPYQVLPRPDTSPTTVSHLPRSGTDTYMDKGVPWTLRYPRRFHALRIDSQAPLSAATVIVIANFRPTSDDSHRRLMPDAFELQFGEYEGGGLRFPAPRDTRLPLTLADFHGSSQLGVQVAGEDFSASVRVGPRLSSADRAALEQMLASIRFPPLRVGHFAWSGLFVLARAASFAPGSVTRVRGGIELPYPPSPGQVGRSRPFYLVRENGGFLELAWPSRSLCHARYDARKQLFRCNDGVTWNLQGEEDRHGVFGPANDQPYVGPAPISSDGYVLANVSATG